MRPWEVRYTFSAGHPDEVCEAIEDACISPIRHNERWMYKQYTRGIYLPCCLIEWGVQYINPPPCSNYRPHPCQPIKLAKDIYRTKRATCIDVVCYMCAYRHLHGLYAEPVFIPQKRDLFHGMVAIEPSHQIIRDYTQDLIDRRCTIARQDCA